MFLQLTRCVPAPGNKCVALRTSFAPFANNKRLPAPHGTSPTPNVFNSIVSKRGNFGCLFALRPYLHLHLSLAPYFTLRIPFPRHGSRSRHESFPLPISLPNPNFDISRSVFPHPSSLFCDTKGSTPSTPSPFLSFYLFCSPNPFSHNIPPQSLPQLLYPCHLFISAILRDCPQGCKARKWSPPLMDPFYNPVWFFRFVPE